MARLLYGKVYYSDIYAGLLQQEPGERVSFTYDASYISGGHPAIAHTLPLQEEQHLSQEGLHPFFDNLVAEGWLANAQARLLGKREVSRFELLLAFGYDCQGAVSVLDPELSNLSRALLNLQDPKELALLSSRASLSGIQPKLAVLKQARKYIPTAANQLSTHIAKFPSSGHEDLLINEYLTTKAVKALLPNDQIVEMSLAEVEGISEPALVIKRFDRSQELGLASVSRIHFEEFNQLLARKSRAKYDGSYEEMASFLKLAQGGQVTEIYRLYARILAGILLGNTDMHLKNFSMFHTEIGLSLTPSYDQVAAVLYEYKTMALALHGSSNLEISKLKPKNLLTLADLFGLSPEVVEMCFKQLSGNLEAAKTAIAEEKIGSEKFKNKLITMIDKRWNGTFASIGKTLSKKQ